MSSSRGPLKHGHCLCTYICIGTSIQKRKWLKNGIFKTTREGSFCESEFHPSTNKAGESLKLGWTYRYLGIRIINHPQAHPQFQTPLQKKKIYCQVILYSLYSRDSTHHHWTITTKRIAPNCPDPTLLFASLSKPLSIRSSHRNPSRKQPRLIIIITWSFDGGKRSSIGAAAVTIVCRFSRSTLLVKALFLFCKQNMFRFV